MRKVINLLATERLLRTEGKGETATVSISHEKLFQAWPALKLYIETNKKMLVDRTLLEGRARKWQEMGKPWFSGLASGREYKDFRSGETTATPVMKDYLKASRRMRWIFHGAITMVLFLILGMNWLWQKGYSIDQAVLKSQSFFASIHLAPAMQTVSGGTFRQGDTRGIGDYDERPVHEVTVKPFAIGKFEVTFEEYDRFAIATGRPLPDDQRWGRGQHPVINVVWQDAKDYTRWLSTETGKRYRLPTESEYEYAARSQGRDDFWTGTSDERQIPAYAVYEANSQSRTGLVGENESRKPNAIGIYDMSGNALEWLEDCAHADYSGAPTDGRAWLEANGGRCDAHEIRGGSWLDPPYYLRVSKRSRLHADGRLNTIGFRLAQDIP